MLSLMSHTPQPLDPKPINAANLGTTTPVLPGLTTPPQPAPITPQLAPGVPQAPSLAPPMMMNPHYPMAGAPLVPYYPSQYVYYPPAPVAPPMMAPGSQYRGPQVPYYYGYSAGLIPPRRKLKQLTTWLPKEDKLLRELKEVQKLGWREILTFFQGRTPNACQFRWRRLINGNSGTAVTPGQLRDLVGKKSTLLSINFLLN